MIQKLFLFLFISFISLKGFGSDTTFTILKKNILFIEGGGKSPYYSVNFERLFRQGKKLKYSWRSGFSVLPDDLSLPLAINAFTKGFQHHLEFSLGITFYLKDYKTFLQKNDLSDKQLYITPGIGYRYQKINGGFFLSAGIDPLIFLDPPSTDFWNFSPEFKPSAHVAAGFSF